MNDTASVHLVGEFKPTFYDQSGGGLIFEDCPECSLPDELYSTGFSLEGGYLLNRDDSYLMREGEQWAAIGSFYTRARFESGAFGDSLSPGVSLGLGYQLPRKFRIAIAARVERALDGDGVKVGPSGYLRWDFLPKWRLRLRGLGLQLEYRATSRLMVFASGFRTSDRFRLDGDSGPGSGQTFRDRRVVVGWGFAIKILRSLRLTAETGAVVHRRLSFKTRDDGTLDRNDAGETKPYFGLRLELRP